jgi:protein ImuB
VKLACVDVPELPLQMIWRAEPAWRGGPTAVVSGKKAASRVREVRDASWVTRGMQLRVAKRRCPELRYRVVTDDEIERARADVLVCLSAFSPGVEPFAPCGFWLDIDQIGGAFPNASAWARALVEAIAGIGLASTVVLGWSRSITRGIARDSTFAPLAGAALRSGETRAHDVLFVDASAPEAALVDLGAERDARRREPSGATWSVRGPAPWRVSGPSAAAALAMRAASAYALAEPAYALAEPAYALAEPALLPLAEPETVPLEIDLTAPEPMLAPEIVPLVVPVPPPTTAAEAAAATARAAATAKPARGAREQRTGMRIAADAGPAIAAYARAPVDARRAIRVLATPLEEREAARDTSLALLGVAEATCKELGAVGIWTLGALARVPQGALLERFPHDVVALHELARGERWDRDIRGATPEVTAETRTVLDEDDDDLERLLYDVEPALRELLAHFAERREAVAALHVELSLKHAVGRVVPRLDRLMPAAATLDARTFLTLLRLTLTGAPPEAPVNAVRLWADTVPISREQLELFTAKPRRDLGAANEALARVRAELGADAVVRPALRDAHLPERDHGWDPLAHLAEAAPATGEPSAVRRVLAKPRAFATSARSAARNADARNDGWLLATLEHGPVATLTEASLVSGGWWAHQQASEQRREYRFADMHRGDCLWIYFDRVRSRWFWQGVVE